MQIIKTSSYTESFPEKSCNVKVAIKPGNWEKHEAIKTYVWENATYDGGFVTLPNQEYSYLAFNFLYHKLKRTNI